MTIHHNCGWKMNVILGISKLKYDKLLLSKFRCINKQTI